MDPKESWSKITERANQARRVSAEHVNARLDAVAPAFAPVAARWDAEADRRTLLRTPEHLKALLAAQRAHNSARVQASSARTQRRLAKRQSRSPFSAARRAAKVADKAASKQVAEARSDLRSARRDYPLTLPQVAARAHAGHVVPAGIGSYVLSSAHDWTTWPAWMSALLIGANVLVVKVGRRKVVTADTDGATVEERQLMERLEPAYWVEHAEARGLAGTVTGTPELTTGGVATAVRLDGQWSVGKLKSAEDQVRSLLGCRSGLRVSIESGPRGGWAKLLLRTRSASDGMSMTWTPEHAGVGVDELTGELVDLPLQPGKHILTAGVTGTGKSVSWRPLMMRAQRSDEWDVLVADPKRQEAIGLQHAVRTVGQETDRAERLDALYGAVQELTAEMHRRQGLATGSVWKPDGRPENRLLLVIIDEGAAIVRMSKDSRYGDVLDLLEELWSESRSVGFQFIWATQFPTKSVGVPAAVKENMAIRVSLTVNAGEAERAIFGETAQQTGWTPSALGGIPGRALIQDGTRRPDPVRIWHVEDAAIKALPTATGWRSPAVPGVEAEESAPARPKLELVKHAPATEGAARNRDRVAAAVKGGATTVKAITDVTGINKGTVSRELKQLVAAGTVRKTADGSYAAGEVSA